MGQKAKLAGPDADDPSARTVCSGLVCSTFMPGLTLSTQLVTRLPPAQAEVRQLRSLGRCKTNTATKLQFCDLFGRPSRDLMFL